MNRIFNWLKKINVLYLYVLIFLLVFSIIIMHFFVNKEKNISDIVELSKQEQVIEVEEENNNKIISVDIKGSVINPGVYEIDNNSRVIDVINKAGGLNENANTELINLSKKVFDEMTIIIYSNEEIEKYKLEQNQKEIEYVYVEVEKCPDKINDACLEKEKTILNVSSETENKKQENETKKQENETKVSDNDDIKKENIEINNDNNLISINKATLEELQTLSGIGEAKAKAIIEYRETNGLFKDIIDITNVSGIGDKQFEKIKDYITI